jgi:hypothetical protein
MASLAAIGGAAHFTIATHVQHVAELVAAHIDRADARASLRRH